MQSNHTDKWLNPFPGPIALSERYPVFGRDEELANLRGLLITEQVVVLHGVSGAGKSSLLRGAKGVRQRFESESDFSVLGPVEFRLPEKPSADDRFYERFLLELLNKEEPEERQQENAAILDDLDLEMFLIRRANKVACTYQLVIIDQFEDVFTRYAHDEQGKVGFFAALGKAVEGNPNLRLLIAMRDEYLGELDHYRRYVPGRFQTRLRLELLRKQEAIDAICRTAEHHESRVRLCEVDVSNLVENLSQVAEISALEEGGMGFKPGSYVEPLFLQLACMDAWPDVMAASSKISGPSGQPGKCVPIAHGSTREDLDNVLKRFYRTVLSEVVKDTGEDEFKLRVFFQDALISTNGLRSLIAEEQAAASWGIDAACLRVLANKHLVRLQKRNMVRYFELAHDRLVEPVRQESDAWFEEPARPRWRRVARQAHLGRSDVRLGFSDLLEARRAIKKGSGNLLPYEARFVEEKENESIRRPAKQFALMVVAGLLVGGLSLLWSKQQVDSAQRTVDRLEKESTTLSDEVDGLKERIAEGNRQIQQAKEQSDRQISAQRVLLEQQQVQLAAQNDELLKKQHDIEQRQQTLDTLNQVADVRRRIASYTDDKWLRRDDQAAATRVVMARRVAEERFPGAEGTQFHAALFTAFNNSLTRLDDAPGYSRSLPAFGKGGGPVAFHGGDRPLMAHLREQCVAITDLRTGELVENCLHRVDAEVESLAFVERTNQFVIQTESELVLITLRPAELAGNGGPPLMVSAKSVQADIDAYALSDDGKIFVFATGPQVTMLCGMAQDWHPCGGFKMPLGPKDSPSTLTLAAESKRRRLFAVGAASGEVFVTSIGLQADEQQGSDDQWIRAGSPWKRIDSPRPIFVGEDRRTVMALRFLPSSPGKLLIVHEDTQIFLHDLDEAAVPERTHMVVRPDVGSRAYGSTVDSDSDHYTSVTLTPEGALYAVLEDAIEKWEFQQLPEVPGKNSWPVPVVRYATGARDLRDLSVGPRFLLGRGYFAVWVWELSELGSKLVLDELSGPTETLPGATLFYPQAVAFAPDGGLITGTTGQGLSHWTKAADGTWSDRTLGTCRGRYRSVRSVALSPDGDMLAAAGAARQLIVVFFDPSGNRVWCDDTKHNDGLWSVAFSSDKRWLVSGEWDDTTRGPGSDQDTLSKLLLWRMPQHPGESIAFVGSIPWKGAPVRSVAFHPTQPNLLAVGGRWGGVSLYRLDNAGNAVELRTADDVALLMAEVERPMGPVLGLSFSADGKVLAAADGKGPIHWWWLGFGGGVEKGIAGEAEVCVSRDRSDQAPKTVFPAGSRPAMVEVARTCILNGHAGGTRAIEFHPSKPLLASGGADDQIRIWNFNAPQRPPALLRSVVADVLDVAWSRSGDRLVAGFKAFHSRADSENKKPGKVVTLSWNLPELERLACGAVWPTFWEGANPCRSDGRPTPAGVATKPGDMAVVGEGGAGSG